MTIFEFIVLAFVVYRVTHLISEEDGPFEIMIKMRVAIGNGFWGTLMDCFFCVSLWVGLLCSFILIPASIVWQITYGVALSGAACFVFKIGQIGSSR
jgi:hypothetical protein